MGSARTIVWSSWWCDLFTGKLTDGNMPWVLCFQNGLHKHILGWFSKGHGETGWEGPWPHNVKLRQKQHHLFFCSHVSWQDRAVHQAAQWLSPYVRVGMEITVTRPQGVTWIYLRSRRCLWRFDKRRWLRHEGETVKPCRNTSNKCLQRQRSMRPRLQKRKKAGRRVCKPRAKSAGEARAQTLQVLTAPLPYQATSSR